MRPAKHVLASGSRKNTGARPIRLAELVQKLSIWNLAADELRGLSSGLVARVRVRYEYADARVAAGVHILGPVGRIHLAEGTFLGIGSIISVLNGGGLEGSLLVIGPNTYIGEYNNIRAAGCEIRIGKDCLISQFCTIVGSNHGTLKHQAIVDQAWQGGGVHIGDGVWVGAGATLLPGSRLGDGCVVAANAVVRGAIEPGNIVAGMPAAVIGRRKGA